MPIRTLCLSLLVLASTAFPVQAFRLVFTGPGSAPMRRVNPELAFAGALLGIAALALAVTPASRVFTLPINPRWYLIALGAGLIAPFAEYLIGVIALRRFGSLRVHQRAGSGRLALLAGLLAALAEEVIFRGIALPLLSTLAGVIAALAVTSIIYGLNHLYFGWLAVAQKTVTGIGLALLFVWSGQSLLIPLIAHATQNFVVLVLLPRREARP